MKVLYKPFGGPDKSTAPSFAILCAAIFCSYFAVTVLLGLLICIRFSHAADQAPHKNL